MICYLYWDPSREMFSFHLPWIDRPILWYGFFFAVGFCLGYWVLIHLLQKMIRLHFPFTLHDIKTEDGWLQRCRKYGSQEESQKARISAKIAKQIQEKKGKQALVDICNQIVELEKVDREFLSTMFPEHLLFSKQVAHQIAEKLSIYVVLGTIIGARLGDVLFYQDLQKILEDPFSVFRVWEGGLASHGGAVGILAALFFFSQSLRKQYPYLTYLRLLDLIAIPAALAGSLIRIGNFFNQEILGTLSSLPWAVVFGHSADGSPPAPRHPVQIYEALFYMLVFAVLWRFKEKLLSRQGALLGLFLVLVFGFRLGIEFFKTEQSVHTGLIFTMGQYLSLPFIFLGFFLLYRRIRD